MKKSFIKTVKETFKESYKKYPGFYISGLVAFIVISFVNYGLGFLIAGLWFGYWWAKGAWKDF
jgi:hypothetical protein